jgi:hypothetical protein
MLDALPGEGFIGEDQIAGSALKRLARIEP